VEDPSESHRGIIICHLFDAVDRTSRFLLFDAFHVAGGPFASSSLTDAIQLGFHSSFRRQQDRRT